MMTMVIIVMMMTMVLMTMMIVMIIIIIIMTMVLLMMIDRMRYSSRPVNTDRSYKCARRERESSYEKNALDPKI